MKKFSVNLIVLFLVIIIFGSICFLTKVNAITTIEHGVISIAFDDGRQSVYDYAFPALASHGMTATYYTVSSMVGTPNFMTVSELQTLQNAGNEIGSHSATHPDFIYLTPDQIIRECVDSKAFFEANGLEVKNFAYPYGDYNSMTNSIVSQYYRSGRSAYTPPYIMQLSGVGFNLTGYDGETGDNTTLSSLRDFVDAVYNANGWAIIFFHNLTPDVTTHPYSISVADFSGFLDYVSSRGIPTMTVNEALDLMAPSPSPTPTPSPSPSSVIFEDGYETGGYSNWQGTDNYAGSSMQMSATTVFEGHYSADCSISNTIGNYAYAYYNFQSVSILYHREYVRVSSLPPPGAETDLFGIMSHIPGGTHLGTVAIQNNGSSYRWKIEYYNNSVAESAYSTEVALKANTWYYVEIMVKLGTGKGQVSVWIAEDLTTISESSPTINQTNLNNGALPMGAVFFGGYVTGASYPVHIYSDSVVVSDSWTGPKDFTSPAIGVISATSHSTGAQVVLSSLITDDAGVDFVISSWNNTGIWVNQTAVYAEGSVSYTAALTDKWSSVPGTVVSAKFYANDTSNNWAAGSQVNFALNTYSVYLSANQTGLTQEDTVLINVNVNKNGVPFSSYLVNASKDGSLFLTNQTTSFTDKEFDASEYAYTASSLYDIEAGENVTFTANTLNVIWAKCVYDVTLSVNDTGLTQGDIVKIDLAVTKNGLFFTNYLANVSRDGSFFLKNVTYSLNDIEVTPIGHAYNVLSLYDAVTGQNVTFSANTLIVNWAEAAPAPTPTPTLTPTSTPVTTITPSTKPTTTPTSSPKPTPTPSPTIKNSPKPTTTVTPSPNPNQEELSTTALICIAVIAVIGIVLTLILLTQKLKLKK